MAGKDKHNPIYMARLAEQTERFDDMIKFVKEIIRDDHEVTEEVNNLISIAYKNVISANRSAWRAVANLEQKEKEKKSKQLPVIKWYRKKLEQKLDENCHEVLGLAEALLGKCKDKNPTGSINRYIKNIPQ